MAKKKSAKAAAAPSADLESLVDGFVGRRARDAYVRACKAINDVTFDKTVLTLEDNFVLLVACALAGHVLPGYATLDLDRKSVV